MSSAGAGRLWSAKTISGEFLIPATDFEIKSASGFTAGCSHEEGTCIYVTFCHSHYSYSGQGVLTFLTW